MPRRYYFFLSFVVLVKLIESHILYILLLFNTFADYEQSDNYIYIVVLDGGMCGAGASLYD